MKAITHSRQTFYEGRPIYWYEFSNTGGQIMLDTFLEKFLRVPDTIYYEFGGQHEDALKALTNAGVVDIMEVLILWKVRRFKLISIPYNIFFLLLPIYEYSKYYIFYKNHKEFH